MWSGQAIGLLFLLLVRAVLPQSLGVSIVTDHRESVPVPMSFMGLSIEPMEQADIYTHDPVFVQLVRNLVAYRTGPLNIRWGGNTQDDNDGVSKQEVWEGMNQLWHSTNKLVTYTIGLNLPSRNTTLALRQIQNARRALPPEAVASLGVGNEPDSYMYRRRKTFSKSYMSGEGPGSWLGDQLTYMEALGPELQDWLGTTQIFQGPAVSNVRDWPHHMVPKFAALGRESSSGSGPFAAVVSSHKYAANSKRADLATLTHLLSDEPAKELRKIVSLYSMAAHKHGLKFRLDETNSLSAAGALGVSNTLAAALHAIDSALGAMQARGDGVNFHMSGCAPYNPIVLPTWCGVPGYQTDQKYRDMCPNSCGKPDARAEVNAPYYGMWLVQQALADAQANLTLLGAAAVQPTAYTTIKLFVLQSAMDVRVVMINTAATGLPINVTLTFKGRAQYGPGSITRLKGGGAGLGSTVDRMSFGGQTIDPTTGEVQGKQERGGVLPVSTDQGQQFSVHMHPASAALFVAPSVKGSRARMAARAALNLRKHKLM